VLGQSIALVRLLLRLLQELLVLNPDLLGFLHVVHDVHLLWRARHQERLFTVHPQATAFPGTR